jgi:hypothetical protein
MNQINNSCWEKLCKAFPSHIQQVFSNLASLASELDSPHQEICIWWEPEHAQEGDLVPSITFRLTPFKEGTDATIDS